MVDGDLLRQLFKSFARNDEAGFREAASLVIRDERSKNHRLLADDLERILHMPNGRGAEIRRTEGGPKIPRDRERDFPLVEVSVPEYSWDRLVVSHDTMTILQQVADENRRRDVLASAGLRPIQRLLFYGPPGCGKTIAAHVLAGVLSLPLVAVRFDAVVSSYLGETAANLRRVFEYVSRDRYVVLFDEFDALGKDRDNPFEHGELKRLVNSLLQLLDSARGDSILVAATNHEGMLDSAVWRRFDAVVPFRHPTTQERVLLLRSFLRGFGGAELRLDSLARQLDGATGADIERICVAAARRAVLARRTLVSPEDFEQPIREFRERLALVAPRTDQHGPRKRKRRGSEG